MFDKPDTSNVKYRKYQVYLQVFNTSYYVYKQSKLLRYLQELLLINFNFPRKCVNGVQRLCLSLNITFLFSWEKHQRFHEMRSNHFVNIFLIIECFRTMFVNRSEGFETVYEGLVGVRVVDGTGSLQPYESSKVGNSFQLDYLMSYVWHHG